MPIATKTILPLAAAEWQWSVEVPSVVSDETKAPPRAFLWIPPTCERVRAVVVGQHNMLEEPLLESPAFRAALAELGFAAVWVSPILCGQAAFGEAERKRFDEMLSLLAAESGYAELANAPVVPIGHSAMADFPYLYGAQCPERTLAGISIKGSWPDMKRPPLAGIGERLASVPLLLVSGEYEWADERAGKSLAFRRAYPRVPFPMLADAGVAVSYYVREGPAEVEGSALRLTRIPPRAKFPVKVTVVARQYGRSAEPRLRSAEQFERVFWVLN